MKKKIRVWWVIPLLIFAAGLYSVFIRFYKGLGASTHLSDKFPWGLWVGFDVMSGVALAAGAFTISAAVYVLRLERYRPLVRPAILTGFIGYLMAITGLMFDLGHPYRIWHPLIMWNPHSVMFEISWCVTLYTTVLAMEFVSFTFVGPKWERVSKGTHAITPMLVILGTILSTLHQSSLGSLFLIVPYKLHPLWYSPYLPVFFFASALAIGCAMVIVESFLSSRAFKKELELDLLSDLSRVLVVALIVYAAARFIDLADRNALKLLLVPGFERSMFLAEVILAPIGPIILLLIPRARANRFGLFMGASMTVTGFILNRFNVSMTGLTRASGTKYFPSAMEISVTIALVTLGVILFAMAAKYLNIFSDAKPCLDEGQSCKDKPSCCLPTTPRLVIVGCWVSALVLMCVGARDFRNFKPEHVAVASDVLTRPSSDSAAFTRIPKDIVFPLSKESPGLVTFSHENHIAMSQNCADCHGKRLSILHASGRTSPVQRDMHSAQYCGRCHDGKSAGNECVSCHKDTASKAVN